MGSLVEKLIEKLIEELIEKETLRDAYMASTLSAESKKAYEQAISNAMLVLKQIFVY